MDISNLNTQREIWDKVLKTIDKNGQFFRMDNYGKLPRGSVYFSCLKIIEESAPFTGTVTPKETVKLVDLNKGAFDLSTLFSVSGELDSAYELAYEIMPHYLNNEIKMHNAGKIHMLPCGNTVRVQNAKAFTKAGTRSKVYFIRPAASPGWMLPKIRAARTATETT